MILKKIIDEESLYPNQVNVVNILFMVDEIFTGKIESLEANGEDNLEVFEEKSDREKQEPDEQLNTTDKQRRVGLKILTPDQMLGRLPITLAQLKAENNS